LTVGQTVWKLKKLEATSSLPMGVGSGLPENKDGKIDLEREKKNLENSTPKAAGGFVSSSETREGKK
jgi:hypothetical protein